MPTPIAVYVVHSASTDTTALTTPSFTPSNGELITVELTTWDTGNPAGAVSGGGQSYAPAITAAPGGFNGYARIESATISGSPGSMAITAAGTATNSRHSMTVTRWPVGCTIGAVNSTVSGAGAPSANITTTAANSAVTWCSVDVSSQDPATAAPRLSATSDGIMDGHVGANSVAYFYRVNDVGTAGTYAMGMTAPGSQTWVLAGVEVKAAGGISSTVGIATETDSAQPLGRRKTRTVNPAGETDTAQPLARRKARTVGVATEADTAQPLGRSKRRTIGTVAETDAAQAVARGKRRTLGIATTTETAMPIGRRKTRAVGTATEADSALSVTVPGGLIGVRFTAGRPHTGWRPGAPHTGWTSSRPHTGWKAGRPHA